MCHLRENAIWGSYQAVFSVSRRDFLLDVKDPAVRTAKSIETTFLD
jgi:hypothetical protein